MRVSEQVGHACVAFVAYKTDSCQRQLPCREELYSSGSLFPVLSQTVVKPKFAYAWTRCSCSPPCWMEHMSREGSGLSPVL